MPGDALRSGILAGGDGVLYAECVDAAQLRLQSTLLQDGHELVLRARARASAHGPG